MSTLILLLLLAAVIALAVTLRPRAARPITPADAGDFRAVSVSFDAADACAAVRALESRRFLCADAPALPLPECTANTCDCRFERHADRRAGARRADETGVFESPFGGSEQRSPAHGRRAEDLGDEAPAPEPEPEKFDPTSTYYDFIAQTGIRPDSAD
ncbi:MAG: hypothetical protein ACR2QV_04685 [Gammaproteobacteria bacterium]